MLLEKLLKITKSLLPYFLAIFYPIKKVQGIIFGLMLSLIKALSKERSDISSKFYDYYFNKILDAKKHKQALSIEPNIKDLGGVIELSRLTKGATSTFFIFGYMSFIGFMPFFLYQTFSGIFGAKFAMATSSLLGTYYTLLVIYLIYKKLVEIKPMQYLLKIFIRNEFVYIFAKTAEIDEEVAEISMQQVQESILLKDENNFNKKFEKLEKDLGVKK